MTNGGAAVGRRRWMVLAVLTAALLMAGPAAAAWEPAKLVDDPGTSSAAAGSTGFYTGLADGANGASTAAFEQTVGSTTGFYSIRRGPSDGAWGAPIATGCPSKIVAIDTPITTGADAAGDAITLAVQNNGGVPGVF